MTINQVKTAINNRKKGAFIKVIWNRPVKMKKAYANEEIIKHCAIIGTIGKDYEHIENVKIKRENGELPAENQGLPWGKWVDGYFPFLIEHKGNYYVRFSLVNGNPVKVRYTDKQGNGIEFTDIENKVLSSEKPKKDNQPDVLTIKIENIEYM